MRQLVLFVTALAVLALVGCDGDDSTAPSETLTPTRAPEDAETAETLELVAERTEELFGFGSEDDPEFALIDDEDLEAVVAELLADEETLESLRRDQAFYSLMGLIPADTDLVELNEELLNAGIAGLYRPEIGQIYVRLFGRFSSLEEATASHEYAHYLQDAHFNLERRFDAVAGDRDGELALRALIEGDASYIENQYVGEYFNEVQLFGMGFGGLIAAAEAPAVPPVFTRETIFVYLDGASWVDEQLWRGFEREELYADPPLTTREVLHPSDYSGASSKPRVQLELSEPGLPAGWSTTAEPETIGELLLGIWLEELGARPFAADEAARGWAADALLVFVADDDPQGLVARIRWESPAEAEEFLALAHELLNDHVDHEAIDCDGCAFAAWSGPSGAQTLTAVAGSPTDTLLLVAPSAEALQQLIAAVR